MNIRNYLLLSIIVLLLSCNKDKIKSTPSGSTTPILTPTTQVGVFTIEPTKEIISKEITTNGGVVAIENTKTDLDGLKIEVPAQAYATPVTFKVSASKIVKNELGTDINIISPLIEIDNGGEYANDIMTLTIPIKLPQGHFASAFMYNKENGEMEVLPILSLESDKIVVATTHFNSSNVVKNGRLSADKKSSILVSSMNESILFSTNLITDFKPGIDDWEFPNYGTSVSQDGNCSSMALTAIYYFKNKSKFSKNLWANQDFGKYYIPSDTFSDKLWFDNKSGHRLVSMVQKIGNDDLNSEVNRIFKYRKDKNFDKIQFLTAAAYFTVNKANNKPLSPIYWRIQTNPLIGNGIGHVVVCIGIEKNKILVADPNLPGKVSEIIYSELTGFTDYNNVGNHTYKYFLPINPSFYREKYIEEQFQKVKDETIGNELFGFSKLNLYIGKDKRLLTNNFSYFDNFSISSDCKECTYEFYDKQGTQLSNTNPFSKITGNTLGVLVKRNNFWHDFQWFDINVEKLEIKSATEEPITKAGTIEKEYTFVADGTYKPKANTQYVWNFGDGTVDMKVTGNNQIKYTYKKTGIFPISLKVYEDNVLLTELNQKAMIQFYTIAKNLDELMKSPLMDYIKRNGMVINDGNSPPKINGYFHFSPSELVSTINLEKNFYETNLIGSRFASNIYNFSNQNGNKIDLSFMTSDWWVTLSGSGNGQNGVITGSGNKFTIYIIHSGVLDRIGTSAAFSIFSVFSGELTSNGIKDFMESFIILDKRGDYFDYMLDPNTGRIFKDKDGNSEILQKFKGTYDNGTDGWYNPRSIHQRAIK